MLYWRLGDNMAIRKGDWKLVNTSEGPLRGAMAGSSFDLSGAELGTPIASMKVWVINARGVGSGRCAAGPYADVVAANVTVSALGAWRRLLSMQPERCSYSPRADSSGPAAVAGPF